MGRYGDKMRQWRQIVIRQSWVTAEATIYWEDGNTHTFGIPGNEDTLAYVVKEVEREQSAWESHKLPKLP